MFDRDIDPRDNILQVYQSYYIRNAYVIPIDSRHKIIAHQYQWRLNFIIIIEDIEEDEVALKPSKYNIISFNELDADKDTNLEIDNHYINTCIYLYTSTYL